MAVKSEDDMSGEIYYEGISPLKGIKKWALEGALRNRPEGARLCRKTAAAAGDSEDKLKVLGRRQLACQSLAVC